MTTTIGGPAAGHGHSNFVFPLLKSGEILECLSELDLEMKTQELKDPASHKQKLRQAWIHLLYVCQGVSEEDLNIHTSKEGAAIRASIQRQLQEDPVAASLHQQAVLMQQQQDGYNANGGGAVGGHYGGVSEIPFFRTLWKLMRIVDYPHFSLRDLHAPDAKRLRHQLSAVINFAKFREEQLKFYAELSEPRQELLQALEEVNEEQKQLQEEWNKSQVEAAVKSEQMALMMEECRDLEQEIARNNKLQAAARKEAALLKRQANDLKNELATATCESKESMAEIEGLKKLVVSSPERRQKQLAESQKRNQAEKENVAALETESRDILTSLRNADEACKDLQIVIASLKELKAEAQKTEELARNLEAGKERVYSAQIREKELQEQTLETERSLQRAEEKQIAQQKQHQMQMEACQEALEAAKSQMLQGEQERRSGVQRVQDAQAHVQSLQADVEQQHAQMQHELKTTIAEYKQVEEKFMERDNRRLQALAEASA